VSAAGSVGGLRIFWAGERPVVVGPAVLAPQAIAI
jgi:hypothetical protein